MATFIPDVKPDDFNNSPGEKEVYEALKLLGKEYTVFYSLSWISIGNERNDTTYYAIICSSFLIF